MNKIKEIWSKNKVLIVLVLILIACFISICVVTVTYFFGGSETVYGDRLEGVENHPITENFKEEYISNLLENEIIEDANIKNKGRILYITIKFIDDISLVEAESKTAASIELIPEDLLSYYDINFILNCDKTDNSDGFTIMGAKNVNSEGVIWNNNTRVESEE